MGLAFTFENMQRNDLRGILATSFVVAVFAVAGTLDYIKSAPAANDLCADLQEKAAIADNAAAEKIDLSAFERVQRTTLKIIKAEDIGAMMQWSGRTCSVQQSTYIPKVL